MVYPWAISFWSMSGASPVMPFCLCGRVTVGEAAVIRPRRATRGRRRSRRNSGVQAQAEQGGGRAQIGIVAPDALRRAGGRPCGALKQGPAIEGVVEAAAVGDSAVATLERPAG